MKIQPLVKVGGISNSSSQFHVSNSILWGNSAPSEPQINDSFNSIHYSLIEGGATGLGNIDMDPLFLDVDGPDNIRGTVDDNLYLSHGIASRRRWKQ